MSTDGARPAVARSRLPVLLMVACLAWGAPTAFPASRRVVRLDGLWEIEQGAMATAPASYAHRVAVPGLADMAQPAFVDVGKKSPLREAFWYRRSFRLDGEVPASAVLKVHKARYGTKVFLNGKAAGEHLPCFTPALLDVRTLLRGRGQSNELVIRVGAGREALPEGMPGGWDFEKYLYIPGIYDSVELILTGLPRIVNVQVVPEVEKRQVRVVAEVEAGTEPAEVRLSARVSEASSGRAAGSARSPAVTAAAREVVKVDFAVPLTGCRLWSPEEPFLYRLRLGSGGDEAETRFGMRSFRFDPQTRRALLNGRPYFMRGTNVTAYRFFEDASRGDKPWRAEWVRRLHRQFKTMHWNSIRYCIGFPPEAWYDIADEEGFLIQDEFPIWLLSNAPEKPVAESIIPEYIEWMRERWNHPSVVIWDAQNESNTPETGKAIRAVRALDLSRRPWENGWAEPQGEEDCVESHPYLFNRGWQGKPTFRLSEMPKVDPVPRLQRAQQKPRLPIIINEYGWLWLTRDGMPTCLTDKIYEALLGPNSTIMQRRTFYARALAALTEFWRGRREAAGVLHFCGLGYSRPGDKPRPEGGATSDHWLEVERLVFEPLFAEYVRESFNPVGVLLDFWDEEVRAGERRDLEVSVVNDLYQPWAGKLRLRILDGKRAVSEQEKNLAVGELGREILSFSQQFPAEPGTYIAVAEIAAGGGKPVRSLRDFRVR